MPMLRLKFLENFPILQYIDLTKYEMTQHLMWFSKKGLKSINKVNFAEEENSKVQTLALCEYKLKIRVSTFDELREVYLHRFLHKPLKNV